MMAELWLTMSEAQKTQWLLASIDLWLKASMLCEMKREPVPVQAGDKYIIRFPAGMRDRIAEAATANNRSMNAEIVARIQASFEQVRSPVGEIEAAAYRTHASLLESQAMGLQHQIADLNEQWRLTSHSEGINSEAAQMVKERVQQAEKRLMEVDRLTKELYDKAKEALPTASVVAKSPKSRKG